MKIGSLFSGIGGLELGLERAELGSVAWQVEADPFCRSVLDRHWPEAARYDDVRTFDARSAGPVSILCGGFPCQDVSVAGRRTGLDGARSSLWLEMLRIVEEAQPAAVVVENVPGLARRGLDVVVGGLRGASYAVEGSIIGADDVGAPHRRKRLFIIGYRRGAAVGNTGGAGREPRQRLGPSAWTPLVGAGWGNAQSRVGRVIDGLSRWLDRYRWPARRDRGQYPWEAPRAIASSAMPDRAARVKALGNAVCPQVAYVVGLRVRQVLGSTPPAPGT